MPNHSAIPYPPKTNDLQHEIELVVCIGKGGRNIPKEKALDHVFGYCVGLDMTRRDLQTDAKKLGRPWEPGKSFDQSAPVSAIVPASKCGHPFKGDIWVKVNGQAKQTGDLAGLGLHGPEVETCGGSGGSGRHVAAYILDIANLVISNIYVKSPTERPHDGISDD